MNVFKLFGEISLNSADVKNQLDDIESHGSSFGSKMGSVFSAIGTAAVAAFVVAGTAAVGIFVKSIEEAAEFEFAMAKVGAVSGATAEEFVALGEKAKQLGRDTQFSMTEIAGGMEALSRAGFDAGETIDAMAGVTALASSQVMELGRAAEITSTVIRGFGLEASEADRVANLLAATASRTNTTVESLGESFKFIAPVARTLGVSLEETAAAIGVLGDNGLQGSIAARALSTAMTSLASPSKQAQEVMNELGIAVFDADGNFVGLNETVRQMETAFKDLNPQQRAAALQAMVGAEAFKQFSILVETGADALDEMTGELTGTRAAFDQMNRMLDTVSGQWTILKGSLSLVLVTLGESMMPILKSLMQDRIIPLVNRIQEWAQEMGGIVGIVGKVRDAINGWAAAHPKLWSALQDLQKAMRGLITFIGNVFVGDWSAAWQTAQRIVSNAVSAIKNILSSIWDALPIPDSIKRTLESAFTSLASAIRNAVQNIVASFGMFDGAANRTLESVARLFGVLLEAVASLLNFLFANEGRTRAVLATIAAGFAAIVAVKVALFVTGVVTAFTALIAKLIATSAAVATTSASFASLIAVKIAAFAAGASTAFGSLGAVLAAGGPVVLALAGIGLLIYGITKRLKEAREAAEEYRDRMAEIMPTIAAKTKDLGDAFDSLGAQLEHFANEKVKRAVIAALEDLRRHVLDVPVDQMADEWEKGVDAIVASFGFLSPEVAIILDAFKPELLRHGQEMVDEIVRGVEAGRDNLGEAARQLGEAIRNGIQDAEAGIVGAADAIVDSVERSFTGLSDGAYDRGLDVGQSIASGLDSSEPDVFSAAKGLADTVIDSLDQLDAEVTQIGAAIPVSFAGGIFSNIDKVDQAAYAMSFSAIDTTKDTLDSHSPSRVMIEIGEGVPEGLAEGVRRGTPEVERASREMGDTIVTEIEGVTSRVEDQFDIFGNKITNSITTPIWALYESLAHLATEAEKEMYLASMAAEKAAGGIGTAVQAAAEDTRSGTQKIVDALQSVSRGTSEHAQALQDLQREYDRLVKEREYLIKNGIQVDASLDSNIRMLESMGATAQETGKDARGMADDLAAGTQKIVDAFNNAKAGTLEHARAIEEAKREYQNLISARDLLIANGQQVDASILQNIAILEALGIQLVDVAGKAQTMAQAVLSSLQTAAEGTAAQADAIKAVQGEYDSLLSKRDLLISQGIEVNKALTHEIALLEATGVTAGGAERMYTGLVGAQEALIGTGVELDLGMQRQVELLELAGYGAAAVSEEYGGLADSTDAVQTSTEKVLASLESVSRGTSEHAAAIRTAKSEYSSLIAERDLLIANGLDVDQSLLDNIASLETTGLQLVDVKDKTGDAAAANDDLATSADGAGKASDDLADSTCKAGEAIEEAATQADGLSESIDATIDAQESLVDASHEVVDEVETQADALGSLGDAMEETGEATSALAQLMEGAWDKIAGAVNKAIDGVIDSLFNMVETNKAALDEYATDVEAAMQRRIEAEEKALVSHQEVMASLAESYLNDIAALEANADKKEEINTRKTAIEEQYAESRRQAYLEYAEQYAELAEEYLNDAITKEEYAERKVQIEAEYQAALVEAHHAEESAYIDLAGKYAQDKDAKEKYTREKERAEADYLVALTEIRVQEADELTKAKTKHDETAVSIKSIWNDAKTSLGQSLKEMASEFVATEIKALLFGDNTKSMLSSLLGQSQSTGSGMSGVFSSLANSVTENGGILKGVFAAIGEGGSAMGTTVSQVGSGVMSSLWSMATNAMSSGNIVGTALSAAGAAFGLFGNQSNTTSRIVGVASSAMGVVVSAMSGNVIGVVTGVIGVFQNLGITWDGIKRAASSVFNGIANVVKGAFNAVTNTINTWINGIKRIWEGLLSWFGLAKKKASDEGEKTRDEIANLDSGSSSDDTTKHAAGFFAPRRIALGSAIVGEAGPEALLPLKPSVLREVGVGAMQAIQNTHDDHSISMERMFDGAVFNVRSEDDIRAIARETMDLLNMRRRGRGDVAWAT